LFYSAGCEVVVSLQLANKRLVVAAVKNQATGHYILNGKGEQAGSRSFIDLGVQWEYLVEADVEALHTDGPLHDPIVVLVMSTKILCCMFIKW